ncbi:HNH endonuclease [Methylobrevis albus]|uniref:HNH domain-containing protein n=1 Tax=Methylobrevis albus TaxID=2793297 RepID=A0A931I5M1_9HYPH|nr:HNH endonuclease [Methylobrevis albus]MBH0240014.1 hypothetical protein [Methylobrevis albus]
MTPIQYSALSKLIVDAFDAREEIDKDSKYWNDKSVDLVRAEIKDHYIDDQHFKCVYCDREIVTANKSLWDAEHVISREKAARFMFTPRNLAVSCRDCNIAKGQKEVRTTTRQQFPDESRHYTIVHPHFDNYADHIRWVGDICVPISDKGETTQFVCRLTRFTAQLLGVSGVLDDPGFDRYVGELFKAKTKADAKAALAAVSTYVEDIPQA